MIDGATHELASIALSPPGDDDVARTIAAQCILDWTGVALAGAAQPGSEMLRNVLGQGVAASSRGSRGDGRATLIGSAGRLPLLGAVTANGFAGHVLDYDDSQLEMEGHPSAPILPAVLALAEVRRSSGEELLRAVVAGFCVASWLGSLLNPEHYEAGWHATATIGTFAAAAACGRLLGLDEDGLTTAFGLAASQAAGLKTAFGTMAKPFQVGKAASNGLLSAMLAEAGVTATTDVVEAGQGFAVTHAGGRRERRHEPLSAETVMRRVIFKHHAACHSTHPGLEALGILRSRRAVDASQLRQVVATVGPSILRICNIERPDSGLALKFSIRGTLAMALCGLDTTQPASFSDEAASDPAVVRLSEMVQVRVEPRLDAWETKLELGLADGSRLVEAVDLAVPCDDVDEQAKVLLGKFENLVGPVLGAARARGLAAALVEVGRCRDLSELLPLCGGPAVKEAG